MESIGVIMATTNLTSLKANALSNVVSTVLSTTGVSSVPKITTITYPGDDTAANTGGGQTISISGTGFNTGASVIVNGTAASVVSVVSATSLTFTAPAQSSGTYALYVVNTDGGTAIAVPGISYSGTPTWSTASGSLGTVYETNAISNTVTATGDATIVYSLLSGALPTGSTLNTSNGLISGTSVATNSPTTYSFTIRATDGQNQDTDRAFSMTISPDTVTWSSPADQYSTPLAQDTAMSAFTMSASSAAGKSITYTANSLPTGLSISGATIVGTPTVTGTSGSLITATAATTGRTETRTFNWVVSVSIDTYWPYTVLLLNGEGTNATDNAQNITVIDSSTNAFTITKQAGTTRQGTFSPFSARGWCAYIDNAVNADFVTYTQPAIGTSAFTIEFWLYLPATMSDRYIYVGGGATGGPLILMNSSGGITIQYQGGAAFTVTGTLPIGQWFHFALVREGTGSNQTKVYYNGVLATAGTLSSTFSSGTASIGAVDTGAAPMTGYISNFRLVNGTAVYTANFTPSTTPLTAITNTAFLTFQSNRFVDNSANPLTITMGSGDPVKVRKFSPFNGTADYSTTNYGGSLYFDTSTYYTLPYNAAFGAGTGDFTLEAWVYPLASSASYMLVDAGNNAGGRVSTSHSVYLQTNNSVTYLVNGSNVIVGGAAPTNQWTHIAIVRISGSTKLYLNGIQSGSTWADSTNYGTQQPHIGRNCDGNYNAWNGYISGLRFVKGTGVYTTTFTPPTAPSTAISGTSYLLNGSNAGIIDQTGMSSFVNQGTTAKITTANKKYGSGSMSFTASNGDYFTYSHPMPFPTAFTIEFWFYPTISQADKYLFCGQASPMININGTMGLGFAHPGAFVAYTSANYITTNTWYHLAYVREGLGSNQTKLYLNGTVALMGTESATFDGGGITAIGAGDNGTQVFTGYIDDLRITYYPRYTTTFTPPTSTFLLR